MKRSSSQFASGQAFRQVRKAFLDHRFLLRPTFPRPGCLPAENIHIDETHDERLYGIQRGEHPGGRSGSAHGEALREIIVSLRLAPEDPDEENTKGIICAELGNLVCAREEWEHSVQVVPDYAPARVNLAILNGSHMSLAWTSSALGGDGSPFAR